jgi:hypothetical protein
MLAVAAAATLTLTACAPDAAPGGDPAAQAPSPEDQTVQWVDVVCSSVVPVVGTLRTPPAPDLDDLAATQQAYSGYLADAIVQAEEALTDIESAEPPPIDGGQQVADDVYGDVAQMRDDLVDAKARVDGVDPADPAALGPAVAGAGDVLSSLGSSAQATTTLSEDPRLEPAFQQAGSCEPLREVGTPAS